MISKDLIVDTIVKLQSLYLDRYQQQAEIGERLQEELSGLTLRNRYKDMTHAEWESKHHEHDNAEYMREIYYAKVDVLAELLKQVNDLDNKEG